MADFLMEIATEEIPASYIDPALDALAESLASLFKESSLAFGETTKLATPRRLAIHVSNLQESQETREVEMRGPPEKAAFDKTGKPTKAALGFAGKIGVAVDDLRIVRNERGRYVSARKVVPGRSSREILAETLPAIIAALPFPKSMRWNATGFSFARPIRSILALLDREVVDFDLAGVRSGRALAGHPFLSQGRRELAGAKLADYVETLRGLSVIVDRNERTKTIARKIGELGGIIEHSHLDEELLREVTHLVEFPNVLAGSFDEGYLSIPEEVLEEAMKSHQRYFPVRSADGYMLARFLAVFNRPDEHAERVRAGNERVLHARLADAQFFWKEDTRTTLDEKKRRLPGMSYMPGMGGYDDKRDRLMHLAPRFAGMIGLDDAGADAARRAAELCKMDLVTEMVAEFPKLQGIMGSYYARHDGEDEVVCRAIREHYLPRFAGDAVPETAPGIALALADKLDHIVCCFQSANIPTGRQDPYAVRRAVQGVTRIVLENDLDINLRELLKEAAGLLRDFAGETNVNEIMDFFRDRLYRTLIDRGERFDLVRAVLAGSFDNLVDLRKRLEAINALSRTQDWPALVELVERTHNIAKRFAGEPSVDEKLLSCPEEKELFALYEAHAREIGKLFREREYEKGALLYARTFAKATHEFFDKVYVNVEDEKVRNNRLALCKAINSLFSEPLADLSDIAVEA